MRRLFIFGPIVLLAACAGQDTAAPCVFRLNVFDMNTPVQVGATVPVDLELSVKSGNCDVPSNANVSWTSSNTNIVEITSQTNTTAMAHAKKQGSAFITAWLTLTPEARDSMTFTVFAPVDQ